MSSLAIKSLSVLALLLLLSGGLDSAMAADCSYYCHSIMGELCGMNSRGVFKTFYNFCSLELHNCKHRDDYSKLYNGKCRVPPV